MYLLIYIINCHFDLVFTGHSTCSASLDDESDRAKAAVAPALTAVPTVSGPVGGLRSLECLPVLPARNVASSICVQRWAWHKLIPEILNLNNLIREIAEAVGLIRYQSGHYLDRPVS